jgi:hypothetical protein
MRNIHKLSISPDILTQVQTKMDKSIKQAAKIRSMHLTQLGKSYYKNC